MAGKFHWPNLGQFLTREKESGLRKLARDAGISRQSIERAIELDAITQKEGSPKQARRAWRALPSHDDPWATPPPVTRI